MGLKDEAALVAGKRRGLRLVAGSSRRDLLQHSTAFFAASVAGLVMTETATGAAVAHDGLAGSREDFDFFLGHWRVSAKRLQHRLARDNTWETVTGTTWVRPILQGAGNMDEDEFHLPGGTYVGGMLRLFDVGRNIWMTYGLSRDSGALQPPLSGRFHAGRGEFYGDDTDGGRAIKVRHLYINNSPQSCRWEQAFSVNGGHEWETNWIIDFTRITPPAGD